MSSSSALEEDVVMVDALPYVDREYEVDGRLAMEVDALVEAEMRTFAPADYLSEFPELEFEFSSARVRVEMERIASGASNVLPLGVEEYERVEAPNVGEASTAEEALEMWKEALEQAQIRLAHQNVRLANLELMRRYGADAWRVHNSEVLEHAQEAMQKQLKAQQEVVARLNRKRKSEQDRAAVKLGQLENAWWTFAEKNRRIRAACEELEAEIGQLKGKKRKV